MTPLSTFAPANPAGDVIDPRATRLEHDRARATAAVSAIECRQQAGTR